MAPSSRDPRTDAEIIGPWIDPHSHAAPREPEPLTPDRGLGLYTMTQVRDLTIEDLPEIERLYQASLIPDHEILSHAGLTRAKIQEILGPFPEERNRGGMLHEFNAPGLSRSGKPTESVSAFMQRRLEISQRIKAGEIVRTKDKKRAAIFEGAVLVPQNNVNQIYAVATWFRSSHNEPEKRNRTNDEATAMVADLFDSKNAMDLVSGKKPEDFRRNAARVLLFDTINGIPGASDHLINNRLHHWQEVYHDIYEWLTLFHWDELNVEGSDGDLFERVGENTDSHYFFERLGLKNIGDRVNPVRAVREIAGTKYIIQPTENWMGRRIEKIIEASDARMQALRAKFSHR